MRDRSSPGAFAGDLPSGWIEVRIGEALEHFAERVELLGDVVYDLISIRRRHGGMFHRERLPGRAILTKSVQRVVPGSFVIARRQIVHGACAIAAPEFDGNVMSMSYSAFHGTPICDARYFFALAQQPHMIRYFWESSHGVVIEKLNFQQEEWLGFPVRLPPLEEQRRIQEILDTTDRTIKATERVIAKLCDAHEGLRQELLPHHPAQDVVEAHLGDLIDPSRPIVYGILMPGDHVHGGVPVIKVKDIRDGAIADRQTLLHTSPQVDQQYARSRVREGDVLFTIRGTVGRTAVVPQSLDGANITQDTARLAIADVNRSYLLAAMAADRFNGFVEVHTVGQAVKGINLRELRKAPVLLLERDQQEVVGAALDDSLARVDAEKGQLRKLRLLRSGLAADLLSGRVRTVAA